VLKAPSLGPKKADKASAADAAASATVSTQKYAQALQAIPEFSTYGPVLKSSAPVALTESGTEYDVAAIKHLFKEHVVLQYDIKNTLADYVLGDVSVLCNVNPTDAGEDSGLEDDGFLIPVAQLKSEETGSVYVSFSRPAEPAFVAAAFANTLKFTLKEVDPATGEPEEGGTTTTTRSRTSSSRAPITCCPRSPGGSTRSGARCRRPRRPARRCSWPTPRAWPTRSRAWRRRWPCSRSRAPKSSSARARTRSSSTGNRSPAAAWPPRCAWPTRPSRASRSRSRRAARRKGWQRWWWPAWRRFDG